MATATPATRRLNLMHASLQFSDTVAQKKADCKKVFDRATARKVDWITGTEAGEDPLKSIVRDAATAHGYTFQVYKGNFVCVNKSIIKPGTYKKGGHTIMDNSKMVGKGHDPNYVWAQFVIDKVGQVTVIGSHYATKGRQGKVSKEYQQNTAENKQMAQAIGKFAVEQGKGTNLVFYGGDQNDNDKFQDTFFGTPLTSIQDELKKYERTHWATIDVIASYDADGRVKGAWVRALDDKEFVLATDHFLLEAGYDVRLLTS